MTSCDGSGGLLACWTYQLMFAPLRAFISDWPTPLYIHWCINFLFLSSCIYTVSLHIQGLSASFSQCFFTPKLISVGHNEDFHVALVRQLFPYSCKTWYVFKVKPWMSRVKILTIWCVKLKSQTFGEMCLFLQALLKCTQSMKLASKLSLALKQVESWERELAWLVNTLKCKSDNLPPFFCGDLFWDISWSSGWFLFYLHSK